MTTTAHSVAPEDIMAFLAVQTADVWFLPAAAS